MVDGGAIGGKVNAFAALADDILVVVEGGPTVQKDVSTALEGLSFNAECIRGVLIAQGSEAAEGALNALPSRGGEGHHGCLNSRRHPGPQSGARNDGAWHRDPAQLPRRRASAPNAKPTS